MFICHGRTFYYLTGLYKSCSSRQPSFDYSFDVKESLIDLGSSFAFLKAWLIDFINPVCVWTGHHFACENTPKVCRKRDKEVCLHSMRATAPIIATARKVYICFEKED